jgi:hypothetical protein
MAAVNGRIQPWTGRFFFTVQLFALPYLPGKLNFQSRYIA